MKTNPAANLTRHDILLLLSDAELAAVGEAETPGHLADGDEYLDMENPARGVRRAGTTAAYIGNVLPKKAVQPTTWDKILSRLESPAQPS